MSQVSFITFFVLNARLLELMTLEVSPWEYSEEFLAEQRTELQLQGFKRCLFSFFRRYMCPQFLPW